MIIFWSVNIYGEDPRFKFRDFYSMSQKNYFVSGGVSIFSVRKVFNKCFI